MKKKIVTLHNKNESTEKKSNHKIIHQVLHLLLQPSHGSLRAHSKDESVHVFVVKRHFDLLQRKTRTAKLKLCSEEAKTFLHLLLQKSLPLGQRRASSSWSPCSGGPASSGTKTTSSRFRKHRQGRI